ncbi:PREDICTED: glycosyltransferase 6-like [Ipomoea nil]|uniref:glycosyltransferase 6-like n=1 Tax=Ipomoea nil TaxID=35883 RepID=UPI00090136C5|nr:PREDICTED: glycosyltransferase 6-like [Ipomoea nil]
MYSELGRTQMASSMSKSRGKTAVFSDAFLCTGGTLVAFVLVWGVWAFVAPNPSFNGGFPSLAGKISGGGEECSYKQGFNLGDDPPEKNFYDDPDLRYTIEKPVKNWDEKRKAWLEQHPSFIPGAANRVLVVTGSQATQCKNQIGDHLLLRLFKNKVDYCRLHGYDIFYNTVLLQPKMFSYWAKVPTVRAAMLAHPEAEWIWWVDSDAAFTDMDFKLPLHRYKNHNLVVHGWLNMIFEKKSWTSVNAGVFLIRNCQWAMDFMDVWASMGPQSPQYDHWGNTLRRTFKDKIFPESDDQSGLIYLILKEQEKWGNKIYVESDYYFEGYWVEIVGKLDNITDMYLGIEKTAAGEKLRRRHAEKVSESYAEKWKEHLRNAGQGRSGWRRPFITHFTGCQPCSGDHNEMYSGETCADAMHKALNFADNQVLRNYGFMHRDLLDTASVVPLPYDFPN